MADGRASSAAWRTCARASVPARVCKANWKGRVAWSNVLAWVRARVREARRRRASPVAIPRTPAPPGFWSAVNRAIAMAVRTGSGAAAWAIWLMAWVKS